MASNAAAAPSSIAKQIADTQLSEMLKAHAWIVPTSQSIHIVALSLVFVCALLISLRLLGFDRSERKTSVVIPNQSKLMYAGLVVLLATGTLQTIAEPAREFTSPAFWIKMALIVIAVLLTGLLSRSVRRTPAYWDIFENRPAWSRIYALAFVATWTAIIFCGRFIGYT
jgi:hypothetical protein